MTELSPQPAEQNLSTTQPDPAAPKHDKPDQTPTTDSLQHQPAAAESGLNLLSIGGEALWNSAVREPGRAVVQLLNQLPGVNISVPERHELTQTTTTLGWAAQQFGSGLGMIAPFKLASAIRPMIVAEDLIGTNRVLADGAFFGAAFTPSDDPNSNFWAQRGISGIVGSTAFGVQHSVAQFGMARLGLGETTMLANPWPAISGRLAVNSASGALAGFASAETNSLLTTGDFASTDTVKQSMASFMVTGFGLDALHIAGEHLASRRAGNATSALPAEATAPSAELQAARSTADTAGASQNALPGKYFQDVLTGLRGQARTALSGITTALSFTAGPPLEARAVGIRGFMAAPDIGAGTGLAPEFNFRLADMEPRTLLERNIERPEPRPIVPAEQVGITLRGEQLRAALGDNLRDLSPPVEAAHRADFDRLMQAVDRRAVNTEPGEVAGTYSAVADLLGAPKLQVDLRGWQRLALAKQMLAQAAEPNSITQGQNITCGPMAIEQMALYRSPGKQSRAIVDVLTKGMFTTDTTHPAVVDLSPAMFERIDRANSLVNVYTRTLEPDVQARATLEAAAQPGAPLDAEGTRTYASQLAQLINANIKWQTLVPESDRAVYAVSMRDPLLGDSGERRLALAGDRPLRSILHDGSPGEQEPALGPDIESRDIQPIYDALTGRDSSRNNFVLLNTKEALTPRQGTRFMAPVELERLLLAGQRPFVVEVDPDHPLFRIGDSPADERRPTRHVVTVEPVLHPQTGENLLRGDRPLFNVTDGLGRANGYTGENGLTAEELYEASLHPSESRRIEVPVALPGVRNFGKIDENVFRGQRPDSPQGIRSLKKEGVTLIIDMIDNPVMQGDVPREQVWAARNGIRYINMKTGVKNLDMNQIRKLTAEIAAEVRPTDGRPPGKVFVHCARGADRAGVVDAVWNVTQNNWSAREALAKMRQYKWSEQMHYARRMGSMVEQVAPNFLPDNATPEARAIGAPRGPTGTTLDRAATTGTPVSNLAFEDVLTAMRLDQPRILNGHSNSGGLEHLLHREITQSLLRLGLAKEGWEVMASEKNSPMDGAGIDYLLVNKHSGEAQLLDGSGSSLKTGSAEDGPATKRVPLAMQAGLISFNARDVGRSHLADEQSMAEWKDGLDQQLLHLVESPVYFDMRYTPFPDFRAQPDSVAYEQTEAFMRWMKERAQGKSAASAADADESETARASAIYADYANFLEGNALRFLAGRANRIASPAFEQRVYSAANNALLDWSLAEILRGRGNAPAKPDMTYHLETSRFKVYADNLDGSPDAERFRLIFTTSEDRHTVVQLGGALNSARVALSQTRALSVDDAKQRLTQATNAAEKEAAQKALRDAQLSEKIDRRLEAIRRSTGITVTRQMLSQFLGSADARQRVARGGGQRAGADGPIVQGMVNYLRSQTENSLLGVDSTEAAKRTQAPSPIEQAVVEQMRALDLKPDSPPDEVAVGLSLIASDPSFPAELKPDLDALLEAYSLEPATRKAARRKIEAEQRINKWLARTAEPQA